MTGSKHGVVDHEHKDYLYAFSNEVLFVYSTNVVHHMRLRV